MLSKILWGAGFHKSSSARFYGARGFDLKNSSQKTWATPILITSMHVRVFSWLHGRSPSIMQWSSTRLLILSSAVDLPPLNTTLPCAALTLFHRHLITQSATTQSTPTQINCRTTSHNKHNHRKPRNNPLNATYHEYYARLRLKGVHNK